VSALALSTVVPSPLFKIVEPLTFNDPVIKTSCLNGLTYEAVRALDALVAVPYKEPVNDPLKTDAVTEFATYNELRLASEPLTMTFFQFGIVYYNLNCG
jgi:hypothetical protein